MNVAKLLYIFFAFVCTFQTAMSRALPQEDGKIQKRSKRSQSADHSILDKQSRQQVALTRKLYLLRILKPLDTSGESPEVSINSEIQTTSTEKVRSRQRGSSTSRHHHKRRRGKGKKGKKGRKGRRRRNKSHKKHRKNRRHRRPRSVADNIITLLEGEQGESILEAIANVIEPSHDSHDTVKQLEDLVENSAKKCKCSTLEVVNQ